MQKILKNKKGSISLFVLLSSLFFLVVVTSVGISFKNKEASIDSQFEKIKSSYEKDVGNEEQIYNEESKKHIVSFDANGGTVSIESKMVIEGDEYGELPTPTRDGYTFKGWNGKNLFDVNNIVNLALSSNIVQNNRYRSYYTLCEPGDVFSISRNEAINNRFRVVFTQEKPGVGVAFFGGTGMVSTYDSNLKIENIVAPLNARYIFVYLTNQADEIPSNILLEKSVVATDYEPFYVTASTIVTQNNDKRYSLTAIWEEDN